jgi:hypothetical protein
LFRQGEQWLVITAALNLPGGVYVGLDSPALVLDQRVRAAFCAMLLRCSGVSLCIRAFPPLRPKATALGSLSFFFDMRSDLNAALQ